jgi:hypothetical protein
LGTSAEADPPSKTPPRIRHWGTTDYRPQIEPGAV